MKQDIRDLFKTEDDFRTLPSNHRDVFLKKLEGQPKTSLPVFGWLKIAAVLLIALTIGWTLFYQTSAPVEKPSMLVHMKTIEAEYLKHIETEWEHFTAIANDEVLVARFQKKLEELDADYQEISKQFENDANNIVVIEAMVENLQARLQILKDIQRHLNILNQKNEQYENRI